MVRNVWIGCLCAGSTLLLAAFSPAAATGATETTATRSASKSTTATASGDAPTTASNPPVHLGRLIPADEAAAITKSMDSLTSVPGTDLLLGYRLSPPAGWYQIEGSTLIWHEPSPSDTHKLTVTVQDAADLRIVPSAKVQVSFSDPSGKAVGTTQSLNFLWDPEFYQYAMNVTLPGESKTLNLHLKVEPPTFRRHDEVLGAFLAQPVSWTFPSIQVPAPVKPEPKPGVPTTRGLFSEGRRPYAEPTPYPGSMQNPQSTGTRTK